ncbi:MAG: condensation domain-containing protein, partial [Thermoanaerobaculia bacterium]
MSAATPQAVPGGKDNIEDLYALSPVQQGMLFHALLTPGASPYLEQGVWTLGGAVDLARFERAWNVLIDRHPILRTVFYEARKQPIQIVLKRLPVPFSVCDLCALPPDRQRTACAAFLDDDLRKPIDLRAGPLMRATLLRLSGDETRFVLTFDHSILDGWSLGPLCTDLQAVYDALTLGVEPAAVDAPPYKDFVVWLSRRDRREALDFWARYLSGFKAPTPLPADRQAEGRRSLASRLHTIAESTYLALGGRAREHRVTVGALVQAAWAVLLARYGGVEEVVFGLTVSGRPPELPGCERMIGPFINTLPVRARLDGEAAFLDLPPALMQHYADLGRHGYLSLPDIQSGSEITPPRKLFDSILIFHNEAIRKSFSSPHLQLIAVDESVERTSYDLTLDVLPGQPVQVSLAYVREIFDAATIERLAQGFERLLESVVASPQARIGELEILPAAEREQVLVEFN